MGSGAGFDKGKHGVLVEKRRGGRERSLRGVIVADSDEPCHGKCHEASGPWEALAEAEKDAPQG